MRRAGIVERAPREPAAQDRVTHDERHGRAPEITARRQDAAGGKTAFLHIDDKPGQPSGIRQHRAIGRFPAIFHGDQRQRHGQQWLGLAAGIERQVDAFDPDAEVGPGNPGNPRVDPPASKPEGGIAGIAGSAVDRFRQPLAVRKRAQETSFGIYCAAQLPFADDGIDAGGMARLAVGKNSQPNQ